MCNRYYAKKAKDVAEGRCFFDMIGYDHYVGKHVSNKIKQWEEKSGRIIRDSPHMQDNLGIYHGLKTHSIYDSLIPPNVHKLIRESTIFVRRAL